ncbi:uncharacterized protein LY89DRAFT_685209 [Mollisia scopiformis]|uniref:ATPase synthesis protein 25 n=1 Tax=Mollisia scopiformis TaxID=149040 RepID=A0A194X8R2_MOLSC|nr:uncharacterized protein LY89DRAFT_685209 [Mollisia scopiformis]KUJ16172.1 hypothetical protein LY89DRAFT_685209 [Mollisia scopiformis]
MVVGRALRATGCAACRLTLLRSFTSLAGPSIRIRQPTRFSRCTTQPRQLRYSSHVGRNDESPRTNEYHEGGRVVEEKDEEDELDGDLEFTEDIEDKQVSAIPWYLQVESPHRAPRPLSERQLIPELPELPPPILAPLMQQVSIDLGLDDLKLLDLRKLDPPPALGANLLMLIGTARSEKHLHVSADRLCRWLRSTYKLKPDVDGLLGRNELKLKLKRKAKRAKLMGSSVDDSQDDGVRTGWVCVDVGVVDEAEGVEESAPIRDFVGFGRRTEGVRIVVQMLTEEKREEINLERLWTGILERGTPKDIEEGQDLDSSETTQQYFPISASPSDRNSASSSGQNRSYHTSARRLAADVEARSGPGPRSTFQPTTASPFEKFDLQSIQDAIMQDLALGNYNKIKNDVIRYSQSVPELQKDGWRPFLLHSLQSHLESVPAEEALKMLGTGDSDRSSTPFLVCFYETLSPIYVSEAEAEILIWLSCFAQEIGHPGYEYFRLLELLDQFQVSGVQISLSSYRRLLRAILTPPRGQDFYHGASHAALEAATGIIQTMHDQGFDILSEDLLIELQELTMPDPLTVVPEHKIYTDPEETFDLPSLPMPPISQRFHVLLVQLNLPLFRDDSRMRLMDLYANRQYWQQFWEIFRMAPRQNKPQSASMYAFMLFQVAQTKHQKACMTVLRTWIVDLQQEDPPIELTGDVSEALKACLLVADPHVEKDANDNLEARGEWISLWRRCQ